MNIIPEPSSNDKATRSLLADYSPTAAKLLAPIFGENCQLLDREQAFTLAEASVYACRYQVSLYDGLADALSEEEMKYWRESLEEKLSPPLAEKAWRAIHRPRLYLENADLLALAEFLHRELRLGRWAVPGQGETPQNLALARGYHVHPGIKTTIFGRRAWANGSKGEYIYRKGGTKFIHALLQQEQSRGFPPLAETIGSLKETHNFAYAAQQHLLELSASESYQQIPLTQEERQAWDNILQYLLGGLKAFLELLEKRQKYAAANDFYREACDTDRDRKTVSDLLQAIRQQTGDASNFRQSLYHIGEELHIINPNTDYSCDKPDVLAKVAAALVQLNFIDDSDEIIEQVISYSEERFLKETKGEVEWLA